MVIPKFLTFNNRSEDFKQIARIGNVNVDGTLKDSSQEAIVWHQDGDFYGEGKNHIFSVFHTRL
jgi:hypothetical protein